MLWYTLHASGWLIDQRLADATADGNWRTRNDVTLTGDCRQARAAAEGPGGPGAEDAPHDRDRVAQHRRPAEPRLGPLHDP